MASSRKEIVLIIRNWIGQVLKKAANALSIANAHQEEKLVFWASAYEWEMKLAKEMVKEQFPKNQCLCGVIKLEFWRCSKKFSSEKWHQQNGWFSPDTGTPINKLAGTTQSHLLAPAMSQQGTPNKNPVPEKWSGLFSHLHTAGISPSKG